MSDAVRRSRVLELFGVPTRTTAQADWGGLAQRQQCPYLGRKCIKVRKSQPGISIGTCSVEYGQYDPGVIICPFRMLERRQVFIDCLQLLTVHEPGNELHIVPEISVPGGSVDYFLVSARSGRARDFAGVELQTLDSTGTLWPERQRFLHEKGLRVNRKDIDSRKGFGMNWKMSAKTVLVQLHHKIETFQHLNKHLVLVVQDCFLACMKGQFAFGHVAGVRVGDPLHLHAYALSGSADGFRIDLKERLSTDKAGIARCLGFQESPRVEFRELAAQIEAKMCEQTRFELGSSEAAPATRYATTHRQRHN